MARKVSFYENMVSNYSTADVMQLIRSAKQRSELKGVPFSGLDPLFFHVQATLAHTGGRCECCAGEFERKVEGKGGGGKRSLSLHRVKASLGYVPENVRIICQACNSAIGEINSRVDIARNMAALEWQSKVFPD